MSDPGVRVTLIRPIGHIRRMTEPAWWEPSRLSGRRAALQRRTEMIRGLRPFFDARGYTEVETPALQVSPGLEPHLAAFETVAGDRSLRYLHTSPEFAMKKLLAAGMDRIWQMARVFRNGERSAKHHPEFSMVEWYRTGASWRDIASEATELVRALAGPEIRRNGSTCDLSAPWEFVSVADAFRRHAEVDLGEVGHVSSLRIAARKIGLRTAPSDTWEDVFFRIFLDRVEPFLGTDAPVILHSYPAPMAALARLDPDDADVAERFEIFICGLELANGYGELTDPREHRRRFAAWAARRNCLGQPVYPVDDDFLDALDRGMPECAGIALGFDRLVMLATGATRIEDVLWAPVA